MSLTLLFLVFAKCGLLCIGGGYMLVPFLISELVEGHQVLSLEQFTNLCGIAQVTPGPIGINSATYVGYLQQGPLGAVVASIGLVFPSFILINIAVYLLKRYEHSVGIEGFMAGARPATLGLIIGAFFIFADMSIVTGHFPVDYPWRWLQAALAGTGPAPVAFAFNLGATLIFAGALWLQLRQQVRLTWLIIGSAVAGALLA